MLCFVYCYPVNEYYYQLTAPGESNCRYRPLGNKTCISYYEKQSFYDMCLLHAVNHFINRWGVATWIYIYPPTNHNWFISFCSRSRKRRPSNSQDDFPKDPQMDDCSAALVLMSLSCSPHSPNLSGKLFSYSHNKTFCCKINDLANCFNAREITLPRFYAVYHFHFFCLGMSSSIRPLFFSFHWPAMNVSRASSSGGKCTKKKTRCRQHTFLSRACSS